MKHLSLLLIVCTSLCISTQLLASNPAARVVQAPQDSTTLSTLQPNATVQTLPYPEFPVPVVFEQDTLLYIYSSIGPFTAAERAKNLSTRLLEASQNGAFETDSILLEDTPTYTNIKIGNVVLMCVTDQDASTLSQPRNVLASKYATLIQQRLTAEVAHTQYANLVHNLVNTAIIIAVLVLTLLLVNLLHKRALKWVAIKRHIWFKGFHFRNYELLSPERQITLVFALLNLTRIFLWLIAIYISLPFVFSLFPTTQYIAEQLLDLVISPVKTIGNNLVAFMPNLVTIVVILVLTHYVNRLLRYFADEVAAEKLILPRFYPDWARPTYNIVKIIVYAFAFITIWPYLPSSDSRAFQGVSVFLGLLISLGSSSAIANIVAGLVITYMRPFVVGQRVKVGEVTGDVVEKTLLVTRLRTPKNEVVTVPNSTILQNYSVNYSHAAQSESQGLILYSTVTIGYDIPWRKVHTMLIEAAQNTEGCMEDRSPFILQTGLEDFYVSYQVNLYTNNAAKMAAIYSSLHQNIQDVFDKEGIEILSPHYRAQRDGAPSTLPSVYQAPQSPPLFNKQQ